MNRFKDTMRAFEMARAILEYANTHGPNMTPAKLYERPDADEFNQAPKYAVTGRYINGIKFHNTLPGAVATWLRQLAQH